MTRVFIDGRAGTTGLRIYDRLSARGDIELIVLSEEKRKDAEARKEALNEADIAFLCLPDDAAREAVSMIENGRTAVIDTSTAHRTEEGWVYGFPEVSDDIREKIKTSKRIAVPGCHASGFIALMKPLIDNEIMSRRTFASCHSLTGYSGGGKKMIAEYEGEGRNPLLSAPRQYGISQRHKHLKEMTVISGLEIKPVFSPIVAGFYSGMEVTIPLHGKELLGGKNISHIRGIYREVYSGDIVKYKEAPDEDGFLSASAMSGYDGMEISVFGCDDRMILTARYDNLGKGASGAAVQCMNIAMGIDEKTGLNL